MVGGSAPGLMRLTTTQHQDQRLAWRAYFNPAFVAKGFVAGDLEAHLLNPERFGAFLIVHGYDKLFDAYGHGNLLLVSFTGYPQYNRAWTAAIVKTRHFHDRRTVLEV